MDLTLDIGERVIIVLFALAFIVATWRSPQVWDRLMIIPEGLTVLFVLFRKSTLSVSTYPLDWGLAVLGSTLGLLVRPAGEPVAPELLCVVLIIVGALISTSAKLSLNTRFGMAPANRGIQPDFAYAFIRHPMYSGYILAQVGFLLMNPTWRNLLIYTAAWTIQIARLYREERWLSQDPAYRAYAESVRYRLFPGLY